MELDNAQQGAVPADPLDVAAQSRSQFAVLGPDTALVRLAVIQETATVHLAGGRCQRREVSVATAFPVDVGKQLPLGWSNGWPLPVPHDRVSRFRQDIELAMHVVPPSQTGFRTRSRRAPSPGNACANRAGQHSQCRVTITLWRRYAAHVPHGATPLHTDRSIPKAHFRQRKELPKKTGGSIEISLARTLPNQAVRGCR